jgi:hypothetical protein
MRSESTLNVEAEQASETLVMKSAFARLVSREDISAFKVDSRLSVTYQFRVSAVVK